MKDAPAGLLFRIFRKLTIFKMRPRLRSYLASMSADHPLRGIPTRIVGDAAADPTEFFTHYDAFGFWLMDRLARSGKRHRVLDVGSPKTQNAMVSAYHDITAVVLADCFDRISNVNYVRHDISRPLPFADGSFDVFSSTVTLPLIGLGRYGDDVDANSLPNFITELGRVMTEDAELVISLTTGPDILNFNNGWFLELPTIKRVFKGWELVNAVVDDWSSSRPAVGGNPAERFVSPERASTIRRCDYRVIFCVFRRNNVATQ
ncbi:hypothetical protein [Rhizobium leguminosarum]|jgi:SAM-dependent methyltransferase|uniref:Methyltransferase type 11 domain-containing protein n=1 Tax=Rhizobium leguminosarum TaxID=384 RepID=A0A2K9YYE9_RHILE|nr:hypothetical protein [Rhizobium leguminosarum]AUW40881.1 hypothetical protein CUJ84_Chr000467 [Rhizobium leguminosarum]